MANLDEAIKHYDQGDFAKSYELLKDYDFNRDNADEQTAFIYARSAFEIGIYDKAEVVYLKLLKKDPKNPRIKLELARIYSQQPKQHFKANTLYQEVLNNKNVPEIVRTKIKAVISSLNAKEQNSFFGAFFGFGVGHNANTHNATKNNQMHIPNSTDTDKFIENFTSLKNSYKTNKNLPIDTNSQKSSEIDTKNLNTAPLEANESILDEAKKYYNKGDFAKSYELLRDYGFNNNVNSEIAFIYARSAYEIGAYDDAEIIYSYLLEMNPNNPRIKLELAKIYSQQPKRHFEANRLYQEVLNSQEIEIPESVRANIKNKISSLSLKEQNNFFNVLFSIGVGHDTNVRNATNAKTVRFEVKPGSNIPFLGPGIYSMPIANNIDTDKFTEYVLALSHSYKANENLSIDTKVLAYSQKFNENDTENLDIITAETGTSYTSDMSKTGLSASYTRLIQDDKSNLNLYTLTPSFEYVLSQNLLYKTKLKLSKKNFFSKDERYKNSKVIEAQNSLVMPSENFGQNTFTFGFGTENADGKKKDRVDNNFMNFKLENIYTPTNHTTLLTGLEYYYTSYKLASIDDDVIQFRKRRKDKRYVLDFTLFESINKALSLALNYRYTNNVSNQNLNSYEKQAIKGNIYYSFEGL